MIRVLEGKGLILVLQKKWEETEIESVHRLCTAGLLPWNPLVSDEKVESCRKTNINVVKIDFTEVYCSLKQWFDRAVLIV